MSQEDDLRGLAKVMDFMRALSVLFVVVNIYWFCYPSIREWNVNIGVVDRILLNFQRTTGLFGSILWTKLFSVTFLALSCLGTKGVKEEKIKWVHIWTALSAGVVLFFFNWWLLCLPVPLLARTAFYIFTLAVGYLCLLAAGVWISRLLKQNLMDDVFNNENESFMQETRLIENEYSVNLPTRFYYGKKWNNGWINVVNPFRTSIVLGTPRSGKSFAVVNSYIKQQIEKGYAAYIYDFKFPDLSTIAYNHLIGHLEGYKVPPKFYVINFDDPSRSHRCNPLNPKFMTDISDAYESSYSIMLNLNRSWAAKQGSGFAVDELTGQITGIGDYRRAVVQAGAAAIGILAAILLSHIDYRSLVNVWPVHVVLTWGLVLPTLVIRNVTLGPLTIGYNAGDTDNYSWYKLGGFTLQPTELAKISFILTFAMHLNNVRSRINEPKELAKLLLHLLVPIAIIHVQGDDGTAIIYGIIGCCMMFAAGLSWKYIFAAFAAAGAAVAVAFAFFSDKIGKGYQWYRILAVLDPENTTGWAPSETVWKNIIYQQQRGEIAIGSGGFLGKGFLQGTQIKYGFVPERHTDFIFCTVGEEWGFVGTMVVLALLCLLILRLMRMGERQQEPFGRIYCYCVAAILLFHVLVNVGMTIGLMPVMGIPLPFMSYGGSSLIAFTILLFIAVRLDASTRQFSLNNKF